MPVTTSHDTQLDALLGACRLASVADAAGVDSTAWASTASPRVACSNGQGYLGGLHRGRLPFIELWQLPDQTWDRQSVSGCGTMTTRWRMRVHVNGPSWQTADSLARAILQTALVSIRSGWYLTVGDEVIDELLPSPLGFSIDADLSMEHTFSRDTYETETIIPPVPFAATGIEPAESMQGLDPPVTITGEGFANIGVLGINISVDGAGVGIGPGVVWSVVNDTTLVISSGFVPFVEYLAEQASLMPPFSGRVVVIPSTSPPPFVTSPAMTILASPPN